MAKWDIVRAKEKEMLGKLQDLRIKQRNMEKCITHIVLHQMIAKLYKNVKSMIEKKRLESKRRMGCLFISFAFKAAIKRKGLNIETRMRHHIRHSLNYLALLNSEYRH